MKECVRIAMNMFTVFYNKREFELYCTNSLIIFFIFSDPG